MKRNRALVPLIALLVTLGACSEGAAQDVPTTVGDVAAVRLPNLDDPEALESTIVGFAECVEESFPIVVRFRPGAFIGMTTEVGSQHREDGQLVEAAVADCSAEFDVDRRINVYQMANPISEDQDLDLVAGFVACAANISPTMSKLISQTSLRSHTSIGSFLSELSPVDAGLTADELVAASDCASEVTGPAQVFAEGHNWFTP
jgi:hypothetical protein